MIECGLAFSLLWNKFGAATSWRGKTVVSETPSGEKRWAKVNASHTLDAAFVTIQKRASSRVERGES